MLQQYNSLVVDASYINKFYEQSGVIGKGRDLYLGISSISYLVSHKTEGGRFILQIYENLGPEVFRQKVLQLQKVMLECVNQNNTRIILIAEKELNDKQSDLYVLYRLNELTKSLDKEDALNAEQARELLITFCKNFLINGRTAYEFLDLAPQNIYVNEGKFIISNMGISYKGSKFHRPYTVVTDTFFKEKTSSNLCYTYAFQAGLVVLCAVTKINSSEFFFNDGQLKDGLLQQVLQAFKEKATEEQKTKLKSQFPSLSKVEKPFEGDLKGILHILAQLLSLDEKKRSIFQLLISYPENPLKVENPFFQQPLDVDQEYVGFGTLDGEKIIPNGYGYGRFKDQWHYGNFKEGQLDGEGTIEIKGNKSILYILLNLDDKRPKTIAEMNKFIYQGEFDEKLYIPDGNGLMLNVLASQKLNSKKKQTIYYNGEFKKGIKQAGKEFYKNKADFDGDFENGLPKKGVFTYGPNHIFDGVLKGFKRLSGKLYFGDQVFEGEFENDKPKEGVLLYGNGNEYKGMFKDGQRSSLEGKYTFCDGKLEYVGNFKNDALHGKGILTLLETKEQIEVEYEDGRLKSDLPENFKLVLKRSKTKQEPQKQQQQEKKKEQKQDDDFIEEDIDQGYADEDGEQNHDMDDEDA